MSGCIYSGCTNSSAARYEPLAHVDDGSCEEPPSHGELLNASLIGCAVAAALNFDSSAIYTAHDSCAFARLGCTDSLASNYVPSADADDGSCDFPTEGCTDPMASNFDSLARLTADGACAYAIIGCMDSMARDYMLDANVDAPCDVSALIHGCMLPSAPPPGNLEES